MRIEGWEGLLNEHIERSVVFQWGTVDCALWCADWIRKATERDLTLGWLGEYSTEDELKSLMATREVSSYVAIADATGFAPVSVAYAQRGDIVLHPVNDCLGICNGLMSLFLTEKGVTRVETLKCKRAWKVE